MREYLRTATAALTDRYTALTAIATVVLFTLAACSSPAEFAATVAAVGTSATAILEAMAPIMSPEQFAAVREGIEGMDDSVQATKSVMGVLVNAFEQFRDAAEMKFQQQGAVIQSQATELAARPDRAEMVYTAGGTGGAATVASRVLSAFKHGKAPKVVQPPAPTPQ